MTYGRVVGRNRLTGDYRAAVDGIASEKGLIAGDLRRLESDSRDERHLAYYAKVAGITPEQVKAVFDEFFYMPEWVKT